MATYTFTTEQLAALLTATTTRALDIATRRGATQATEIAVGAAMSAITKREQRDDPVAQIHQALAIASELGTIDGGHHKMWIIDQMVRALLGAPVHPALVKRTRLQPATEDATRVYQEASAAHHDYQSFCAGDWDEGMIP